MRAVENFWPKDFDECILMGDFFDNTQGVKHKSMPWNYLTYTENPKT